MGRTAIIAAGVFDKFPDLRVSYIETQADR
jgi:hypothetical protein